MVEVIVNFNRDQGALCSSIVVEVEAEVEYDEETEEEYYSENTIKYLWITAEGIVNGIQVAESAPGDVVLLRSRV